ncbi:Uma2 family endonuclease [Fulvivirga sp. M361]|uniref:Uma2 family endonuclease n=1 Tax=Fulvivirga sp. M361 TaxID=2594266 RepID=UPI001179D4BF|nr:Uma2 family endonuclease [Fulvivirga sp. M361]TRX55957.1 Uma2 family endonuclease [Fulvivirga sp. M361]
MPIQPSRRLINVEEYYSMAEAGILTDKDRVELIHGEILEMSPIGSRHASVVMRMNNVLSELIKKDAIVNIQNPIRINDLNEPEPDITLLKYQNDYYADHHPQPKDVRIVIEVSDSTYAYDKEIKLPLYASARLPEYWIINLEKSEIEVYKTPSGNRYKKMEIFYYDDEIRIDFCSRLIKVKSLIGTNDRSSNGK